MDTFVLKKLAGHASLSTTQRYIHMNDSHTKSEMERNWEVQGTTKNLRSDKTKVIPIAG